MFVNRKKIHTFTSEPYKKTVMEGKLMFRTLMNACKTVARPIAKLVLTSYYLLNDKCVSAKERRYIMLGIFYFIFPLDLIPDFIPVVGYLDDSALLLLILRILIEADISLAKQLAQNKINEL